MAELCFRRWFSLDCQRILIPFRYVREAKQHTDLDKPLAPSPTYCKIHCLPKIISIPKHSNIYIWTLVEDHYIGIVYTVWNFRCKRTCKAKALVSWFSVSCPYLVLRSPQWPPCLQHGFSSHSFTLFALVPEPHPWLTDGKFPQTSPDSQCHISFLTDDAFWQRGHSARGILSQYSHRLLDFGFFFQGNFVR